MKKIFLDKDKLYKFSMGIFFKTPHLQSLVSVFEENRWAVMHRYTGVNQGEHWVNKVKIGDYIYITFGKDKLLYLAKIVSECKELPSDVSKIIGDPDYLYREYKIIAKPTINHTRELKSETSFWLPSGNSTLREIRNLEEANEILFKPYYNVSFYKNELEANNSFEERELFSGRKTFQGINDSDVTPQLHASIISENFARLLINLKDNKGQMLGLFGQWGRGKTFLMNLVRKELNKNSSEESSFYHVDFHAWKYQDTQGVWAYLYQQIAEEYFTHKKGKYTLTSKLKEYWLLIKLNYKRNGLIDVITLMMVLILIISITLLYPRFVHDLGFWNLLFTGSLSMQTLLFLKRAWKLGDKGKRLIKQYTHKPNFNKLLGVQAEIQDELKYVLKAWMPSGKGNTINKRLLLFVDDLDRCKEERLIQVIDALRVMLEDEEIVKRVIVVTAIDENILERAIELKYKEFLNKEDENRKGSLIKEYLDKLFIACIKLPPLYEEEKDVIIDTYAAKLDIEILEKNNEIEIAPSSPFDEKKKITPVKVKINKESIIDIKEKTKNIEEEQEEKQYTIRLEELNLLKEKAKKLKGEITPRQLRIFMYRYLLAKNLAKSFNNEVAPNQEWCAYVLDKIVEKRNKNLEKESNNEGINEELRELTEVSGQLEEATHKIIEIVAPY